MNTANQPIIPEGYHDYIYRFTYWSLAKIAPTIPAFIKPNQITMAAFVFALIGTLLLYTIKSPIAFIYWILFNFIWYILDALDGMHARITGQTSEYGAFLDHALDNIYFCFMLTVFAVKFDLMHTLYVYILLLRTTAAIMVFTVQYHTKKLYLTRFSGGLELILFSAAMLASYHYPHFNPLLHTQNPLAIQFIDLLSLQQGAFMKCALLVYFIGVPINMAIQFQFVKKNLLT